MLVKIKINKDTLEYSTEGDEVKVNHIIDNGTELEIEVSSSETSNDIEVNDGNIY